jgi:hypothetical protein
MGSARRFGSTACPACSDRFGLPMISRFTKRVPMPTGGGYGGTWEVAYIRPDRQALGWSAAGGRLDIV